MYLVTKAIYSPQIIYDKITSFLFYMQSTFSLVSGRTQFLHNNVFQF